MFVKIELLMFYHNPESLKIITLKNHFYQFWDFWIGFVWIKYHTTFKNPIIQNLKNIWWILVNLVIIFIIRI